MQPSSFQTNTGDLRMLVKCGVCVFFFRGDPERLCTFRCLVPTYIGKDLSKRKCSGKDPEFYFHFSS